MALLNSLDYYTNEELEKKIEKNTETIRHIMKLLINANTSRDAMDRLTDQKRMIESNNNEMRLFMIDRAALVVRWRF